MNAYTISKLAKDAGVSVYVVRDYVLRGLLHPAQRTESGYNIFDASALARLQFVRVAFEAGIGLHVLTRLCHALDGGGDDAVACLERLRLQIAARREALTAVDGQLAKMAFAARPHVGTESRNA
ncbi:MAG: mercuric resistance transcriptional repressor MerD [Sulfuriferula sp.]